MNPRWIRVGSRTALALALVLSGLALALVQVPPAYAVVFDVDSFADEPDANPGSGGCATAGGACTLRAAIEESNANGEADVIRLGTGTYTLTAGTLPITTQIEVVPNQATDQATITSNGPTLFTVNAGGDLTLTRLTLTGATAGPAVDVNAGTLTITTSTLTNNASGAIRVNGATAAASVTESTISGNAGGVAAGVDVAVAGATVTLTRLTIVDNAGGAGVGGVRAIAGANVSLAGSIVANNTGAVGADCDGTLVGIGVNMVETPGGGCTVGGTVLNVEPALGALAANGGTTQTRLPALNSPAVDAGGACTGADQRGVTRNRGAGCELGSVELPVVTFVSTAIGVTDSNTTATLSATLDAALPFDLDVGITLGGGTAVAGTDYNATVLPFTFTAGTTADTTDVTILRNTAITGNRTFNATATSGAVPGNGAVTITITDVDAVVITWDQLTYTVSEAAGTLTVRANLSQADIEDVTITFNTVDGGARAGTEYVGITGGTIVIPQGQLFGTTTITITNNGWYGLSKNFLVRFASTSRGSLGPIDTTVTITEDDAAPAAAFSATTYAALETDINAVLTVTLPYTSEVATDVTYTIANGTAVAGADFTYAGTPIVLTIPVSTTSAAINVPLINNIYYSGLQSFTVNLTGQTPGALGTPASATVNITDNETPPTVTLGTPSPLGEGAGSVAIAASVTYTSEVAIDVSYTTVNGTAESGSDFNGGPGLVTITAGNNSATISIGLIDNAYYSGQQQFTVQLVTQTPGGANTASTTVVINDNESLPVINFTSAAFAGAENGGAFALGLSMSPPAEVAVTVPFVVNNGTDAVAGSDFTVGASPVTFGAFATTANLSVTPADNGYHSDTRTFGVVLQTPSLGGLGATGAATVSLTDNEGFPSANIADPGGSGYVVNELAGSVAITVTLSHTSTQSILVNYATQNGSATSPLDFQGTTGSAIEIAARQLSATLSIPIYNNNVFTRDEFFTVQLSGQSPGATGSPTSTQVTIIDAQQPPNVQFTAAGYNVPRDIGTTAITVTLSAPTGIAVTVNYTVTAGTAQPGTDYVLSNGVVTFAPGQLTQTIPVQILNSGLYVGDRTFGLGLSAPSAGTLLGDNAQTTVLIRETNARRLHLAQLRNYYNAYHEYEPNTTRTSANGPLTTGLTYTGQFNVDQVDRYGLDQDTWRFQVANPGPVTVTVIGNDPGRQIKVINAGGADVPGGYSGDPAPTVSYTFNVTAAGTYYVRLFSSSQLGTGTYQLRVVHP